MTLLAIMENADAIHEAFRIAQEPKSASESELLEYLNWKGAQ